MTKQRYAVILWVHRPSYKSWLSETIPLTKQGNGWVCPDGKLNLRHLGLQRVEGEEGRVVEACVNEPELRSLSDYFVFVGQTQAEADTFAAGALAMRAACELVGYRIIYGMTASLN